MREPYAQVVNIGTNNDGHTKEGITFPSAEAQGQLARQVAFQNKLLQSNANQELRGSAILFTGWS